MQLAKPQMGADGSRMTLSNVIRGKQARPAKILLYGVEGVGKSTFASQAPAPIFLCSEDGTAQLDVARFPSPRNWADVLEAVRVLTHEEHTFKTLVIDTVDWLEPMVWHHVCALGGKQNIEEFGYGKGYVLALDQWRTLISRLEMLQRTRKLHVVLLGHAAVRKIDDPQTGPFDRYRLKVHEKSSDVLREWVDAILFARHEVGTRADKNGKLRGVSSGHRIMHTQWTAAYDAKNRFDLPEKLPLSWEELGDAIKRGAPADAAKLKTELLDLIPRLQDAQKANTALREWAGDNPARLAQLLDKVRSKLALEGESYSEQREPGQAEQAPAAGEG